MQLFQKKRIEIVVEAPVRGQIERLLDGAGVGGYTVLPALAGRGHGGKWNREGLVGAAGQMVVIMTITDEARAKTILDLLKDVVAERIAIVSVSTVDVLRDEHF